MNNDTEFSRVLKEILGCLYTAETKEQKDLAYNKAVELINTRFGACPKCGHINTGGKFCSECGQQLNGEVPVKNDNVESIDYLIAKKCGNSLTILSIENTESGAVSSLRRQYSRGINADLYKRTIEMVDINQFDISFLR